MPWDHPRSRGVYPSDWQTWTMQDGSSPLARGLPHVLHAVRYPTKGSSPLARGLLVGGGMDRSAAGIIPARAGFTTRTPRLSPTIPDHPRSRGVYANRILNKNKVPGSSPLARGLPSSPVGVEGFKGIIPARAGFTARTSRDAAPSGDHPRSRGVYNRSTP